MTEIQIVPSQSNRSARRSLMREQSRLKRKEEKRQMKNTPEAGKFNSKKSHKVAPMNPTKVAIKNTSKEKAAKTAPDQLTEVSPVAHEIKKGPSEPTQIETPATVDKEETQETIIIAPAEQPLPQDQAEEEAFVNQEKKEEQEEVVVVKETKEPEELDCTIDDDKMADSKDETISNVPNSIDPNVSTIAKIVTADPIISVDETSLLDDTKKEVQKQEATVQKKESISDRISTSTSTSSATKKKKNIISKLFSKNTFSKKESAKDDEKTKKKPKAWKIWKKL